MVYRNGDHGIDVLSSVGQLVVSNTVYRSVDSGIEVQGSGGATIRNNISVDNGINSPRTSGNIRIVDSGSASRTTLNRDLLYLSSGTILIDYVGTKYSTLVAFRSATGQEQNGRQGPPMFVAAASGDFHLLDGSPAIDSADSGAPGQPAVDADGRGRVDDPATTNAGVGPRAFDDRGAYEFVPPAGNRSPVAGDDTATTALDTAVTLSVLANDSDPDGDALTVTGTTTPAHGSATANANNTVTYTPAAGYSGPDSFSYTISDGHGGTDTGLVSLTVSPGNRPPSASNDTLTTSVDVPATVSVLANDTDPDGDALTVTGASTPANGTTVVNANGSITYTPAAGYVGTDSFTYTISDGRGGVGGASVSVTVSEQVNLVGNPGFETDTAGWQTTGLARVAGGHSGSFAAELSNPTAGAQCTLDDKPNWILATQAGPYVVSLWARSDVAGRSLKLRVREYSSGTNVGSTSTTLALDLGMATGVRDLHPGGSWIVPGRAGLHVEHPRRCLLPGRRRVDHPLTRRSAVPSSWCLCTRPSFITNATRWVTVMSVSGSPGTPTMSASISGAMRPRSGASMSSALTVVAARIACSGVMPRLTRTTSSSALRPCQMAGASLPQAILTPASMARVSDALASGNTSAALACTDGGCAETSQFSVRALVETRKVPVFTSAGSCRR